MEPVLTCAAEIWGLEEEEKEIENFHLFAIKRLLSDVRQAG